jgi:hypothetical protein
MLRESTRRKLTLYLTATLFLHIFLAWHSWHGIRVGLPDFSIFYTAGEILREGRGSELYDDRVQETVQRSFTPGAFEKRVSILPYNHPPFEALVFVPFAYLPYLPAYFLWLAINLGFMFALLALLRKNFAILGSAPMYLWMLAGLGFYPLFNALLQGQDSILVLFCFALGFLAFRQRAESRAGAWLGLGLFKFHLVLPFVLPLMLLRRKKFLAGFFAMGLALALLGLAAVGWKGSFGYPFYVWAGEHNQGYLWNSSAGNTANVRGLVTTLCSPEDPRLSVGLIVLVSAMLLGGVTYAWRKANLAGVVQDELVFALGLVSAVLLSYHIYVHDLSLLFLASLIVLEVLLSSQDIGYWTRIALYGCVGVLFCSPVYLVLALRYRQLHWIAGVLLIFFVVLFLECVRIQRGARTREAPALTGHPRTGGGNLVAP